MVVESGVGPITHYSVFRSKAPEVNLAFGSQLPSRMVLILHFDWEPD